MSETPLEALKRMANRAEHQDGKSSLIDNPKDAIGRGKLPVHLVPDTLIMYAVLAYLEGALKYGKFNWRRAGVSASVYIDALERHLRKFKNGEWADPQTRVPHLASMLACIGIMLDADALGMLVDDRPPPAAGLPGLIDGELKEICDHLRDLFKDHDPHQHTILDLEPEKFKGFVRHALHVVEQIAPDDK